MGSKQNISQLKAKCWINNEEKFKNQKFSTMVLSKKGALYERSWKKPWQKMSKMTHLSSAAIFQYLSC